MHNPESEKSNEAEVVDTGEYQAVIAPHVLDGESEKPNAAEMADTGEYETVVIDEATVAAVERYRTWLEAQKKDTSAESGTGE